MLHGYGAPGRVGKGSGPCRRLRAAAMRPHPHSGCLRITLAGNPRGKPGWPVAGPGRIGPNVGLTIGPQRGNSGVNCFAVPSWPSPPPPRPFAALGAAQQLRQQRPRMSARSSLADGFAQAAGQRVWWLGDWRAGNLVAALGPPRASGTRRPRLLFYPPGAYWLAAAVQRATGLGITATLLPPPPCCRGSGAALAAFGWLRSGRRRAPALAATALFSRRPHNMLVPNPFMRFAYAEIPAPCLLLVALGPRAPGTSWSRCRRPLGPRPDAYADRRHRRRSLARLVVHRRRRDASRGCRAPPGALSAACSAPASPGPIWCGARLLPEIDMAGSDTGGLTSGPVSFLFDAMGPSKAPDQNSS